MNDDKERDGFTLKYYESGEFREKDNSDPFENITIADIKTTDSNVDKQRTVGSAFKWKTTQKKGALEPEIIQVTDPAAKRLMERYAGKSKNAALVRLNDYEVHLQPNFEIMNSYWYGSTVRLGFRLGQNKYYILKDLKNFLDAFEDGEEIRYGKALSFPHFIENFDKESQQYIHFLQNHYLEENNRNLSIYRRNFSDIRKYLYLNTAMIDLFFREFGPNIKTVKIDDVIFKTKVVEEDPKLMLKMYREKNAYILELENIDVTLVKGQERLYIYENGFFYRCSKKYSRAVSEFLDTLIKNKMMITIVENDMKAFYSTVLEKISDYITIQTDEDMHLYEPEPLCAKVYFDAPAENFVMAKVFFNYGSEEHEGFKPKSFERSQNLEGEYIVERSVKNYLKDYNTIGNYVYIDDDQDKIFDLFSEGLAQIAQTAEVFATKQFQRYKVKPPVTVKVGIHVNADLLDLSFDLGGLDLNEVMDVLNSYRQSKKYHRLKDGSFINIEDNAMNEFSELVDVLGLNEADLVSGMTTIPKYRSLYLDALLKQSDGIKYDRDNHFKQIIRDIKDVSDSDFKVPENLKSILRNYQKTGFRWLKTISSYGFGGILADDMGLGKTIEVISLLVSQKDEEVSHTTSLVICPSSLVLNWESEINRFATDLKVISIMGTVAERQALIAKIDQVDVMITSYDSLKRDILQYKELNFQYEIIDEAQYIKNHNTQNAKSVKVINCVTRFALTGTPVENSLSELWSIYDYLMPGYLFTYRKFREKFEIPIVKEGNEKALERLRKLVAPFILRRLKKDVLKELPEKTETTMYANLEGDQKKLYLANLAEIRQDLANEFETTGFEKSKIFVLAMLTRLRQICCDPGLIYDDYHKESAKLDLCMELVETSLESGHKLLLFSQFTSMLRIIEDKLKAKGIVYYQITGQTKAQDRLKRVNLFNEDDTPVFLISLKAGGTGLNLTGADVVIHYDPWWNLSAQNQATDRAHRIGQLNSVQVYNLIAKDTIEEKIRMMQQSKADLADSIIREGEGSLAKMSKEEIIGLFD
ncbi:MAG: DEAD/DEAH box helicase [Eubacterium sp.]